MFNVTTRNKFLGDARRRLEAGRASYLKSLKDHKANAGQSHAERVVDEVSGSMFKVRRELGLGDPANPTRKQRQFIVYGPKASGPKKLSGAELSALTSELATARSKLNSVRERAKR